MSDITDVARRAGVSPATVSRVYNQPEIVSPGTRERVLSAAAELQYVPHAIARGLATGRSGVVGLIVPDITNPYFGHIARGCADVLNSRQITVALYNSDEQSSREHHMRLLVSQRQADGLIVASQAASISETAEKLPEVGAPTVYVERRPDQPGIDAVLVDNRQAAKQAAEYLMALGHRRIATITGLMNTITGQDRFRGFVDRLAQAGIQTPDAYVVQADFKLEGAAAAARKIMALVDPPTAVFVASDLMAYGAIGEFVAHGWRVPGDISVIGCEDLPFSQYFVPTLTTIRVPIYDIGRRAAQLLMRRLQKPSRKPTIEVLGAELVARQSTCRAGQQ